MAKDLRTGYAWGRCEKAGLRSPGQNASTLHVDASDLGFQLVEQLHYSICFGAKPLFGLRERHFKDSVCYISAGGAGAYRNGEFNQAMDELRCRSTGIGIVS